MRNPYSFFLAAWAAAASLLAGGPASGQAQFREGRKYLFPQGPKTIFYATSGDVDGDGTLDVIYGCEYAGSSST